jgi:4-amino-4-deoxy-L-arabinose transferase-like glycosyltransferase
VIPTARLRTELLVGAGFLVLAALLRAPSFLRSVIDWDESLYFLMAEAWRHGHAPYLTLWDNKPVGIYVLFLGAITLFGDGVWAIRIAAILAVAATAFLLHRLMGCLAPENAGWAGPVAGTTYILGALGNGGMAANTELFIAPFTCLALLLALGGMAGPARSVAVGVACGAACMVKYVAVFESLPIYLVLLAGLTPGRHDLARRFLGLTPAFLAGAILPFLAAALPYLVIGHGRDFVQASLASNLHRVALPFSTALLNDAVAIQLRHWAPLYAAPVLLLADAVRLSFSRGAEARRRRRIAWLLVGWTGCALIGVAAAKSFYQHYFLQVLPPLAASFAWVLAERLPARWRAMPGRGLAVALLALAWPAATGAGALAETLQPVDWQQPGLLKDRPAAIAADLRPVLSGTPDPGLYVFDYEPILYSLAGTPAPTRYAFPSFMISRFLSTVAGVDPLVEFRAIMARHPLFVIRSRLRHPSAGNDNLDLYAALDQALLRDYAVWRQYDAATVYRRKAP